VLATRDLARVGLVRFDATPWNKLPAHAAE